MKNPQPASSKICAREFKLQINKKHPGGKNLHDKGR